MAIIFNIGESLKQSAFNILQEPIKMLMENEKEAFEKESFLSKVFVMKTTDKYQEEYRSSTAMDGFKPTEDLERPGLSDFQEGYGKIFRTQIWTNSFVVSKQTIEDNQMMSINAQAMGFIKSYGRTRERYGAAMLSGALSGVATFEGKSFDCKGGDTETGAVDGAKQKYFYKAHKPVKGAAGGVDQANRFYVAETKGFNAARSGGKAEEYLLDVIGQVQTKMINYRDDKGNILCVNPDTLVIPNFYAFKNALLTALKTQYTSAMGDNGVNLQYGNWNVVVSPYLNGLAGFAETDYAFIMLDSKYNKEALGAVWFDRVPLTVKSYIDEPTEANIWAGRSRFGVGFNNFRAMAYVSLKGAVDADGDPITTILG
nr:MAG TPA: Major capsid protein [Caudoviricetes sp.]